MEAMLPGHHDEDAPIIKLVNEILFEAIEKKASDIHFESYEQRYRIRLRQDGILTEIANPSAHLANQIHSRIKIMANLDISERRLPQDGRFKLVLDNNDIDCRVSTCPTIAGEKVVIRILDSKAKAIDIHALGLSDTQLSLLQHIIHKPQGLIIVTGPTGSGKTLTLYSILEQLNNDKRNILSAEDPVEIKLEGINQVAINPKIGLCFSSILRSFLRQDPDVIMIGEIRDQETAAMAIEASQTGHLVLTTLHTNSAADTLIRLQNLGVPAYDLASSLELIIAQRLVRKWSHDHYSGRIGLFELMPLTPALIELIHNQSSAQALQQQAIKEGMQTMYQSGLEKIKAGVTNSEEVQRVCRQ